ncbi:DUF805 domain-containing protein [Glaesserella sp.]|uniref:DUF805 domain-containing protein n=1 Tax=Glaesserella sp. TaxID=2094731 RepID=UPI00359FFBAC
MRWYFYAIKNIFNYSDRARRREYGWFFLGNFLVSLAIVLILWLVMAGAVLSIVSFGQNTSMSMGGAVSLGIFGILIYLFLFLYGAVVFLVSLSVTARRLHDLGWSGWWQILFYALPIFAFIPFLGSLADMGIEMERLNTDIIPSQYVSMANTFELTFGAVCLVMLVISCFLMFKSGQPFDNKYGPNPKAGESKPTIEIAPQQVEPNASEVKAQIPQQHSRFVQ